MNSTNILQQLVAHISGLIAEMEAQAFQQAGFAELSMRQITYLETIIRLEHPSFGELADGLGVTRPSVTAIVSKLVKLDYVQKVQDHEDLRSFHIVPTEKGKEFTRVHADLHQSIVHRLTSRLNEVEIQQLAALLAKALDM